MANMVMCPNGHAFDMFKFNECPHCGLRPAPGAMRMQPQPIQPPMPQMPPMQPMPSVQPMQPMPSVQPMQPMPSVQPMQPMQPPMPQYSQNGFAPPPQQPVPQEPAVKTNSLPVVGWLVCLKGPGEGKSYAIRENRNFLGRSKTMDIAIEDDDSVSREKHAVITYVPKQKFFLAQPGESRELFYVNDKVVLENVTLNAKDILEIGRSKFMFVPLCGEKFSWDEYSRN